MIGRGRGSGSGRWRSWQLRFGAGSTLESYAMQLDYFGIELGVLLPGNQVTYALNLSKDPPDRRTGAADEEQRYYLTWRRGELEQADRELLVRAGIDTQGKIILKFLPAAVEADLAEREKAYAGDRADNVRRTVFEIYAYEGGYKFRVADQSYR